MIGLYPNLLPQDFRKQLEYPEKLPDLEGSDLEKGLMALIDYLKDVSDMQIHSFGCADLAIHLFADTTIFLRVQDNIFFPSKTVQKIKIHLIRQI